MWASQTGQFGSEEMAWMWSAPTPMLAEMVAASPPVVALRCLAEVMLNGDVEKLTALLADSQVNAKWQAWQTDDGLDYRDQQYAIRLDEYLAQMSSRRLGPVEAQLPDLPVVHVQLGDLNYPHQMQANDTSLWGPYVEPGTRIILRCDQVNRPYFPTASFYEPGTVISCGYESNGRYLIGFRHDPWPPQKYVAYSDYLGIKRRELTEVEIPLAYEVLEPGAPVVLTCNLSNENFYVWGEVMSCTEVERQRYICRVKILPGQV